MTSDTGPRNVISAECTECGPNTMLNIHCGEKLETIQIENINRIRSMSMLYINENIFCLVLGRRATADKKAWSFVAAQLITVTMEWECWQTEEPVKSEIWMLITASIHSIQLIMLCLITQDKNKLFYFRVKLLRIKFEMYTEPDLDQSRPDVDLTWAWQQVPIKILFEVPSEVPLGVPL